MSLRNGLKAICWFLLLWITSFSLFAQKLQTKSPDSHPTLKLAPPLLNPIATKTLNAYRLYVNDPVAFPEWLRQHLPTVVLKSAAQTQNILTVTNVSEQELQQLLLCPWVTFVDVPNRNPQTERALPNADLTANHIAAVHQKLPELNGLGLTASIKEKPFDTTDIDFKGRILKNQIFNQAASAHATDMATLIGGGGNSTPASKGVAWSARLTASDFAELMPDNTETLRTAGVTVQNHAYGVAVENYYGLEAVAYDQQNAEHPQLLHVFSSGNAGNSTSDTGPYAGIKDWANLTGQFKMSKNTLSVGATDTSGQVSLLSSRGPAYDGRIKPELVAFGAGGSSEAAAVVSGIALLVQQAYQIQTNNLIPPASLVKAVLLNSADDKGRSEIDFEAGFGHADAFGAVQTIREKRFFMGTTAQDQTRQFRLQVPPGTQQLKITLVWHDPAASPNAAKALINDLDLTLLQTATGQQWQPWVLNSYPHPDSLRQLPKRQADHLNNAEQITLDFPAAGQYELQVKGYQLAAINQDFSLAYEFITGISWRYPVAGSYLVSNQPNRLRWEGSLPLPNGRLEYRLDNSSDWQLISDNVDLQQEAFTWVTPPIVGSAQLRLKAGNQDIISDKFMLAPNLPLQVGYNCDTDFMLYWPRLPEIQEYQVYRLGKNYMEPFLRTADTLLIIDKSQRLSNYYAVAPIIQENAGPRSYTLDYIKSQTGCYVQSFLPRQIVTDTIIFDATLSSFNDITAISLQRLENGQFKTIQTIAPVNKFDFVFTDLTPKPGRNDYRLEVMHKTKGAIYSQPENVFYTPNNFIQVYPNPISKGQLLYIVMSSNAPTNLLVYDSLGRLVISAEESGEIKTISTEHLKPGLYFVWAKNHTGKYIARFLVI